MGQALYRKYRSKNLGEIIGQEHITQTLDKAIKAGRISHAYLFTGPRGVGKTSIARILAHEINGLPYVDDRLDIDIIEIDAASNRRIDEIRELRDKVHIAPTSSKYKVYIIDEVHMLTKEAFNALLKTLEEPPAHVVFILATTDAHKLPETIVSRTQRYTFKPVAADKVVKHLSFIAQAEKISISDEALELLAEHGEGSFRDSISLLDQASSNGQALELADIQSLLGIPPETAVETLVELIESPLTPQSAEVALKQLSTMYDQGFQAAAIAKQLGQKLRTHLLQSRAALSQATLDLLGRLIDVPTSHNPERYLEIVLLDVLSLKTTPERLVVVAPMTKVVAAAPAAKPDKAKAPLAPTPSPKISMPPAVAPASVTAAAPASVVKPDDAALWPLVLAALKLKHNTLYGVVRMAQPRFEGDSLELGFTFAFHQKRISDIKNRQIIMDIIEGVSGRSVAINCILLKPGDKPSLAPTTAPTGLNKTTPTDISQINSIFGGGELLDS
ncbi:MAG: DNA polymerase III subunit gamma/tau [Candidatus Saccharibacteria bacterium]